MKRVNNYCMMTITVGSQSRESTRLRIPITRLSESCLPAVGAAGLPAYDRSPKLSRAVPVGDSRRESSRWYSVVVLHRDTHVSSLPCMLMQSTLSPINGCTSVAMFMVSRPAVCACPCGKLIVHSARCNLESHSKQAGQQGTLKSLKRYIFITGLEEASSPVLGHTQSATSSRR